MKLGKRPATTDTRDLLFSAYYVAKLPPHPAKFGHESLVSAWQMLGNDTVGDCVFAGGAHEEMLWCAEGKSPAAFSTASVLSDYSAVTGYTPDDPNSDVGTDVRTALKYRVKTGLLDARGVRHKLGAYLKLEPGDTAHLLEALYLFGAVGIGWQLPDSAQEQFSQGHVWSVVAGAQVEGGHYTPLVAQRTHGEVVTWGRVQAFTTAFYETYCDEAWALLSPEILCGGKSPEGFDLAALTADLKAL